ncbi:beta-propeller fold lactonase family protein [Kosakonia sp. S42]|uniref:beta-propeller fold lactonase family protein n=1 Tax=Kosakonia sp. S42 TaxID=2767458 RepID=UPI002103C3BE|nr:beta-propeller fold lactonase family protein [Kosakonia sp. S42]
MTIIRLWTSRSKQACGDGRRQFAISDHNGPHAHTVASDPDGKSVYSADLGLGCICQ